VRCRAQCLPRRSHVPAYRCGGNTSR
jgi:hypothetical protein